MRDAGEPEPWGDDPRLTAHRGAQGADTGVGVAPDDAGRIFGMFARAGRGHDGTGIGLAVCRRVVEAHGGGSSPPTAAAARSLHAER
jgi:signal transduction histidine kinase